MTGAGISTTYRLLCYNHTAGGKPERIAYDKGAFAAYTVTRCTALRFV
jgi:hypothetical protein